jgi:hypothetical protein
LTWYRIPIVDIKSGRGTPHFRPEFFSMGKYSVCTSVVYRKERKRATNGEIELQEDRGGSEDRKRCCYIMVDPGTPEP